jgi:hypothetical protein
MAHGRRGVLQLGLGAVALVAAGSRSKAAAQSAGSLSLEEVIARHTAARGGAAAFDAVESETVDLELTEKGETVQAKYRATKDPFFRIDIYDKGKHVFCEGMDADGPWIWPGDKPQPQQSVPDARKTALQGITFNLYGLHAFPKLGDKLALSGRERIEGIEYYVIEVTLQDSYQTFLYIDPQTWMILRRRDFRSFHPDLDTTKKFIETQYTDFRTTSGVRSAYLQHTVDLKTGDITSVAVTKKLIYNPGGSKAVFARTYKMT